MDERHDDSGARSVGQDSAAEDLTREEAEHKHPAQPVQTDAGYAEGLDQKPDPPEEELEPDFARGIRTGPEPDAEHTGRFSEGIEQNPDDPEHQVERRFSEGIERSPTSE